MSKHDKWIIGEGQTADRRWYVIHTENPRFIVEIFDDDEISVGLSWSLSNGGSAGNPVFIDEPQQGPQFDALMFSIGAVLETYDRRVIVDNKNDN